VTTPREDFDVVIVGAGPSGLACAIAARQASLRYVVIEKGCLVNSIFNFPTNMVLFSTPELLEIGGVPFIVASEKPTRTDLLKYYRSVTEHFDLNLKLFEKVESVTGQVDGFDVQTQSASYRTRNVVVATGQYDTPNLMNIPGETLDKVSHYYSEPHPFYKKKVAVIGGKNSAVEAALDLFKHGAKVTLIHRGDDFGRSVKYWILPDIKNRVREKKIQARFNTVVKEIRDHSIIIQNGTGEEELENDFVFALTGYRPDLPFMQRLGIGFGPGETPCHDPDTLATNVPGIYIAGVITAGSESSKVFIENSRDHGKKIIGHILHGAKN